MWHSGALKGNDRSKCNQHSLRGCGGKNHQVRANSEEGGRLGLFSSSCVRMEGKSLHSYYGVCRELLLQISWLHVMQKLLNWWENRHHGSLVIFLLIRIIKNNKCKSHKVIKKKKWTNQMSYFFSFVSLSVHFLIFVLKYFHFFGNFMLKNTFIPLYENLSTA